MLLQCDFKIAGDNLLKIKKMAIQIHALTSSETHPLSSNTLKNDCVYRLYDPTLACTTHCPGASTFTVWRPAKLIKTKAI